MVFVLYKGHRIGVIVKDTARRRRLADCATALLTGGAALGLEHTLGGRRVSPQFRLGPAWPAEQFTAAIRAMSPKLLAGAVSAERAFKRTNHGVCGLGREVLVAAFATGAQR